MGEFALGQPVPRFEDPRLIRGGGRYVDDLQLPKMALGWVLRSPHAHARNRGIDTSAAKTAPGVLLVLTGEDWAASGWNDLPSRPPASSVKALWANPPEKSVSRRWSRDKVRFRVGDYVAFVVATNFREQAMDAAEPDRGRLRAAASCISTAGALGAGRSARLGRRAPTIPASSIPRAVAPRPTRRSPRPSTSSDVNSPSTASPPPRMEPCGKPSPTTTRPRIAPRFTPCCSARTATAPSSPTSCRCRRARSASSPAISAAASG